VDCGNPLNQKVNDVDKKNMGRRVFLFLLIAGSLFPAFGFQFYPSGHLAASVSLNESYFDFSNYSLQATGLVELIPQSYAKFGVYYHPSEPISPLAWIDYNFAESFRIQLGRFPVPFGAFNELGTPRNNPMVTAPLISVDAVPAPWLDWGARLQWMPQLTDWEALSISAYLCNGLGYAQTLRDSRQLKDNNHSNSFGTRIAFNSPRIGEFGVSGFFGARDENDNRNLALIGIDARSRLSIVELKAEYVAGYLSFSNNALAAIKNGVEALAKLPAGEYQSSVYGVYMQASLHFSSFVVPAVRLDIIGYDDIDQKVIFQKKRLGLGVSVYPVRPLVIKFEFGILNNNENQIKLEPLNLQLSVSI